MRYLPHFFLLLALSSTATAEVFSCKQADGTTAFSYVPCRVERPVSNQPEVQDPEEVLIEQVEVEISPRDYQADITALEAELDQLQIDRELEIAAAPFSTSNPDLLNNLKAEIRANYQSRIDDSLKELVHLRAEQKRLN